ncbi:Hsp70 family protein, partial [Mycoplasmopsis bovis]|uniref:Hsp70 family protein n=1 Tax=Mycoplasmopsis bovis TaxID=28903 RepID=UPI003D2DD3F5
WLIDLIKKDYKTDVTNNKMAMARLKAAAEKAKIDLSSSQQATIMLPFLVMQQGSEPISVEATLRRSQFEEMTSHLVEPPTKITSSKSEILILASAKAVSIGFLQRSTKCD